MKTFLRRISPKRAVSDFAGQWKQPTPHRWQILGVACAASFALFFTLIPRGERIEPRGPELVYISTFEETRSDAEIIASNCANQQLQDEIEARIAESEEAKRELYRQLGRATFVDVDSMEAEAEAERASQAPVDGGPTEEELALSIAEYCARAAG